MPTGPRAVGDFCWINVLTPEPAAAQPFFRAVLGWEFRELPGMGHIITVDGHDVGGMWDLHAPTTPPGTPAGIGVMIRVADADAIAARAVALGGKATPPFDIGPNGRMGEITDPTGAMIDTWQPAAQPGMTADPTRHGVPSWIEAMVRDAERAAAFYAELFGWTRSTMQAVPGMDYIVFRNGEAMVAGLMQMTPDMPFPPHWGTYITVDDVDATVATAMAHGGTTTFAPHDIPGVGRIAGIASPGGVHFSVMRSSS